MNGFKGKIQSLILLFLDLLSVIASFFSVDSISTHILYKKYDLSADVVLNLMGTIVLAYIVVFVFFNMNDKFMKRGALEEFLYIVKMNIFFMLVVTILLFVQKNTRILTRGGFAVELVVDVILMYVLHMIYKASLKQWMKSKIHKQFCYIVTTRDKAEKIAKTVTEDKNFAGHVFGMCILDEEMKGEVISGIPVVSNRDDMLSYASREIVDIAFINIPNEENVNLKRYIHQFEKMGISVNLTLQMLEGFEGFDKQISLYGPYPVISFDTKKYDENKMFIKRCFDVFGSLIGIVITLIIGLVVAPLILIESRGPIIFKQKRVGTNVRYFYIYKFRSMCRDAEKKKEDLMEQNEMSGQMFKMSNDPRITKIGKFIRKTSIDELPQFFNVLKGDMSLVGTRPPTVDEFNNYSFHHKRRLSMKPGITGLWQISGRNEITDFEEVVKLDLQYIDNWSLILDIKIILKTILVVFTRKGSR